MLLRSYYICELITKRLITSKYLEFEQIPLNKLIKPVVFLIYKVLKINKIKTLVNLIFIY